MAERHKLRQWQKELDDLSERTGISLDDVCVYLGVSYNRDVGFYVKLPKKRRTIIGIGMAFGQPVDVINRWITSYAMKRRLYSKDISEDMIWIYLINRNCATGGGDVNLYKQYERYQEAAFETYLSIWREIVAGASDTSDVDRQLSEIAGSDFDDLKNFVINNLDSFKTAYGKPRRMLARYVDCILTTNGKAGSGDGKDSLISLRGWLDDSMINYLSGSYETINVTDIKTGSRVPGIKHIPKNRRSHIALALSLGLTRGETDEYLELMGYLPLTEEDPDDSVLIRELDRWDEEHPLQRLYKEKHINDNETIEMSAEDELQAVSDMLMLRQDLKEQYKRRKMRFLYSRL